MTPNDSDAQNLIEMYNDTLKPIQNKFSGSGLSLFQLSSEWTHNFTF